MLWREVFANPRDFMNLADIDISSLSVPRLKLSVSGKIRWEWFFFKCRYEIKGWDLKLSKVEN